MSGVVLGVNNLREGMRSGHNISTVCMEPYFRQGMKMSLRAPDYHVRPETRMNGHEPSSILMAGSSGFVLTAPRKNKTLDIALLSYEVGNNNLDLVQLQSGQGVLREITPINWACALLDIFIAHGNKLDVSYVSMPTYKNVQGADINNWSKLEQIYDVNARAKEFYWIERNQQFEYYF